MRTLLDDLLNLLEAETGLRASFDDLSGVSLDYPELRVSEEHAQHCSPLCLHAKLSPAGYSACSRDKFISNRLVVRRGRGLCGQCYMGLTDIAEPLVVAGRILGVFYFGSVRVADPVAEARAARRIAKFCRRHGLPEEGFHAAAAQVPVIDPARLPELRERLGAVVRAVAELCTAWAAPAERYRLQSTSIHWGIRRYPALVQAVLAYVRQHFGEPCQVRDLARHFRCHPDYLSRVFLQHTGTSLSVHVRNLRMDRARRMLQSTSLGIGEIGARCGYPEPAHFTRVFRQTLGHTPGEFRIREAAARPNP